jgi:nucleotide-binding universal stress UspA family protein
MEAWMAQKILVAHDLSDSADEALRQGAERARSEGATLGVIYVGPELPGLAPFLQEVTTQALTDAATYKKQLDEMLRARTVRVLGAAAPFDALVETGSAAARIVDSAERWAADLLVVGSVGASGLKRLLIGSVAERVMRYAHCPVLVVRPAVPGGKVLAATDLSDPSLPAIRAGADEARRRGTRLHVIHVIDFSPASWASAAGSPFGIGIPVPAQAARAEHAETLGKVLDETLERLGVEGEAVVEFGGAAAEVLRTAESLPADLLVVGSRGRTGLARIAIGSVAEAIVRGAPCSVLVVRLG